MSVLDVVVVATWPLVAAALAPSKSALARADAPRPPRSATTAKENRHA